MVALIIMILDVLEGCVVVQIATVALVTVGALGCVVVQIASVALVTVGALVIRDIGGMCSSPNSYGSTSNSGGIGNNGIKGIGGMYSS